MSEQEEENVTPEEDTTFDIGDYKSFFSNLGTIILYLLISLFFGAHILYYLKHKYDDFTKYWFPTNPNEEPFCMNASSECTPASMYSFKFKHEDGKPYEPKFKFNYKRDKYGQLSEEVSEMFDTDQSILTTGSWLGSWLYNRYMYSVISSNKFIKFMLDIFKRNISDNNQYGFVELLLLLAGIVIFIVIGAITIKLNVFISFITGFKVYNEKDTESYMLNLPALGSIIALFRYLFTGNYVQSSILAACILPFFIPMGMISIIWWVIKLFFFALFLFMMSLKICGLIFIGIFSVLIIPFWYDKSVSSEMYGYIKEYSKGIMIFLSFCMIYLAATFLNPQIVIGMILCVFFIMYINTHKNDIKKN